MSDSIRKLAVIVFTDIVDFTRLSADNEPVALQLLDTQRSILKPIVERHHGKWLKEIGDGLLLSFNTSKDAVDCAIEIQHTAKNIGNLNLRIGIHQGEVIQQGEDIVGDDVNVASRIESFAAPGGIVLSDRVLPSLLRDPLYQTKSLGSPELKGVKQKVEIYSIVSHGLPEGINKDKKKVTSKRSLFGTRGLLIGLSALILVLTAYYYKSQFSFQKVNDLSIAVLPFANMSTDKENEYFSDGITEEILNSLAQMNKLYVAARTSSFAYKDKNEDIRKIGKQLSVAHILEGSVRKFGDDIKVTAQLIRVKDGFHMWSDTYARKFIDIFKVQEEISSAIAEELKIKLIGGDIAERKGTTNDPEALDLYMRGRFLWNQNQEKSVQRSIEYFKKALEIDSKYALAESAIADAYYSLGIIKRWTVSNNERSNIFQNSENHAKKALSLEPELGEAYAVLGELLRGNQISAHWKHDEKLAEEYFLKAINLNPKYTPAYIWYSYLLHQQDRIDEALGLFNTAFEIDPLSARVNIRGGELYNMAFKDYSRALTHFDKAFELDPYLVYGSVNYEYTTLLERLYQWNRAERSWEYAYQTDSTFFGTLWGMTNHYLERGMNDKANIYLKKFKDKYLTKGKDSQGAADIFFLIAYSQLINKEYISLVRTLEIIHNIQPCQTWFSFDYAYVMNQLNRNDQGEKQLSEWIKNCNDDLSDMSGYDIPSDQFKEDQFFRMVSTSILKDNFVSDPEFSSLVSEIREISDQEMIFLSIFLHVLVKDYDIVFEILQKQVYNYNVPRYINVHPIFDGIIDNPKFAELKRKMNFN